MFLKPHRLLRMYVFSVNKAGQTTCVIRVITKPVKRVKKRIRQYSGENLEDLRRTPILQSAILPREHNEIWYDYRLFIEK